MVFLDLFLYTVFRNDGIYLSDLGYIYSSPWLPTLTLLHQKSINYQRTHSKTPRKYTYQIHISNTQIQYLVTRSISIFIMTSEQYIASAKQGLIDARSYLQSANWTHGTSAVKTCINYINASQMMFNDSRLDERLWILNEVQQFAYHDPDAGGITELATWCEIEYNRILSVNPLHVGALQGKFENLEMA